MPRHAYLKGGIRFRRLSFDFLVVPAGYVNSPVGGGSPWSRPKHRISAEEEREVRYLALRCRMDLLHNRPSTTED